MRIINILTRAALAGTLIACVPSAGCTANIHDNTVQIKDPKVSFVTNVDVNNVSPGETMPIEIKAQNVYLVDPDDQPPPLHVEDAGHFQIYFDDLNSEPLVVTAQTKIDVKIPEDAKAGKHKLLCRVHKHDGAPTSAVFEIELTIKVEVPTG